MCCLSHLTNTKQAVYDSACQKSFGGESHRNGGVCTGLNVGDGQC